MYVCYELRDFHVTVYRGRKPCFEIRSLFCMIPDTVGVGSPVTEYRDGRRTDPTMVTNFPEDLCVHGTDWMRIIVDNKDVDKTSRKVGVCVFLFIGYCVSSSR